MQKNLLDKDLESNNNELIFRTQGIILLLKNKISSSIPFIKVYLKFSLHSQAVLDIIRIQSKGLQS